MKITCIKCGNEIEVKYGLNFKGSSGTFMYLQCVCDKCKALNEVKRVLSDTADAKEVESFIKKQNYIG